MSAEPKATTPAPAKAKQSPSTSRSWIFNTIAVLALALSLSKISIPDMLKSVQNALPVTMRYHAASMQESNSTFEAMREEYMRGCPSHQYKTRIFSEDPLIVYIEDYLSHEETRYILHLA